jgi:hypothetical protein
MDVAEASRVVGEKLPGKGLIDATTALETLA